MLWIDVVEVLEALDGAAVGYWVAGGWGVDLLVGAETRPHRDLDLAVDGSDHDRCMTTLAALGYVTETDWLPLRVEVVAPGERWVDVHPVNFDVEGFGIQGDPTDVHFVYPPDVFTAGRLHGRAVPCLSVSQQERFHSGYEPRPQDEHDIQLLASLPR